MKKSYLPSFFDPANAEKFHYNPDIQFLLEEAMEWKKAKKIKAAGAQIENIHLLLIDVQKDFCFPEGTLYVAGRSGDGAIQDNVRIANFIYENMELIKDITTTMDTHFAFQIFFPSFWLDKDGNKPAPHTIIATADILEGKFRPDPAIAWWLCNGNYAWLEKQVIHYTKELEKAGKYSLYLWPPHCILGTDGHAVAGIVQEARMFHNFVRGSQSLVEIKGGHPLTENYSVLGPEVLTRNDGGTLTQKNTLFIEKLIKNDILIIAGQAASHCVKSTIDDLLTEINNKDPQLARKVFILEDCMSSVTVPDGNGGFVMDFTDDSEAALKRFSDAGMNLIKSTDKLPDYI